MIPGAWEELRQEYGLPPTSREVVEMITSDAGMRVIEKILLEPVYEESMRRFLDGKDPAEVSRGEIRSFSRIRTRYGAIRTRLLGGN